MEKKYFLLEVKENTRAIKIIQIIFGIICVATAIFWVIHNLLSLKSDSTLWITIIFLSGFGTYQVFAGFGKTERYVETGPEKIILKQSSLFPKIELRASDIEAVEIFPLSIMFRLKNKKKIIFRFGLSNTDIINPVKDEVVDFAGLNSIHFEEKKEEI
jgi:putative Mn2+ efflux pump MntP